MKSSVPENPAPESPMRDEEVFSAGDLMEISCKPAFIPPSPEF